MRRTEFEVRTVDGRRLFAEVAGPEDGILVVSHSGTPGTRHAYEPHLREVADRGMRQVTYSRPGYEGSDRLPGRCFADCVPDTVAVVDALGVDSFHVLGNSGGAAHALSCAALLPNRVISAAVVSGTAPRHAPGLDWLAGMGEANVREFAALDEGDVAMQRLIEDLAARLIEAGGGSDLDGIFDDCFCDADRRCLVEPFLKYDLEGFRLAMRGGIWGWFDDNKAACGEWGFDPAVVEVPLSIWHGEEDGFVPASHGSWLAGQLPAADFHLLPGEGHASMYVRHYGAVLDELVAAARQRG